MGKKFKVLRIVAFVWKVLAWVILVLSVLSGCGCLTFGVLMGDQLARTTRELGVGMIGGPVTGVVASAVIVIWGILVFLPIYALGEMIDVALALEENTRAMAEQLKNSAKAATPVASPS